MNILWKEWRQQRLIFVLGCGLGIIFPCVDLMNRSRHGWGGTLVGSGIVACVGALYALILAVATTHDDVQRGVSEFWQSRPVRVGRVLTTKLLLGAGLLLAVFLFVESLDMASGERWGSSREAWNVLTVTWPIAVLLFSAAKLFTVLMRDAARAVMATIWLGLLIYFLPLLAGGLRWMNVFDMLYERGWGQPSVVFDIVVPMVAASTQAAGQASATVVSGLAPLTVPVVHVTGVGWFWRVVGSPEYLRYMAFAAVMTAGAIGCLILSIAAARRQWRWQPGQKTLAWTIGLSAAVIFSLAMFQVGHNLEPATAYKGRPIDPMLQLGSPAERAYDWASPPMKMAPGGLARYMRGRRICTNENYLYAVDSVSENPNMPVQTFDGLLDICRFPADTREVVILSRTRFAVTPPLSRTMHSGITICSVWLREHRLFVVYQVCVATGSPVETQPDTAAGAVRVSGIIPPDTYSLRILAADVSDPAEPRRIADEEIDRSQTPVFQDKGDCRYGEFCYIWEQRQLLVVSLADLEHPQVVRRISIAEFGLDPDLPLLVEQLSIAEGKLLCVGQRLVFLFDLAEPQSPRLLYRDARKELFKDDSLLIGAGLYADGLLYLAKGSGLEVHRLTSMPEGTLHGELIGWRTATPLERLTGRSPHQLMLRGKYLYEAAELFGMLVYDVSDPTRPRRAYHASGGYYAESIGEWNGLLYMSDTLGMVTLVEMPGNSSAEPQEASTE